MGSDSKCEWLKIAEVWGYVFTSGNRQEKKYGVLVIQYIASWQGDLSIFLKYMWTILELHSETDNYSPFINGELFQRYIAYRVTILTFMF